MRQPSPSAQPLSPTDRLHHIEQARAQVLRQEGRSVPTTLSNWIVQSWQRCLDWGLEPERPVGFDLVSTQHLRHLQDAHHELLDAARTELDQLARAIAQTHYFALLTNADGVVIDTRGVESRDEAAARAIGRVGVDLSEQRVGTSAIGAALREQRSVWLHRGEHFFRDTSVYSCAGAPLFDADGRCIGMLDLTGVNVPERPQLQGLASACARRIEQALLLQRPAAWCLQLNWPGQLSGNEHDGWMLFDDDGLLLGANSAARQLCAQALPAGLSSEDVFATSWPLLRDLCRRPNGGEVPLWSGLHVQVRALPESPSHSVTAPLKAVESDLIQQTMQRTRGNVAEAARLLGISRATLYRRLGARAPSR